ncbi:MAG TPA: hypothetical protein VFF02_00265 [Anaeromyxobacteraceae bacterium]|nr:hypothetical protein [Anaeromyxobacteraceae bacterium]
MLLSFLAAATWVPAVLGLGTLLRLEPEDDVRIAVNGFAGLGVVAAAGMAVHPFAPVAPLVGDSLILAGLILFWRSPRAAAGPLSASGVGVALLALLCLARLAQQPGVHYDAGLYQLPMLRWTTETRLVPGLANLHFRFGFDTAWIPAAAATEHHLLVHRSPTYLNALPVFLGLTAVARSARSFVRGSRSLHTSLLVLGAAPVAMAASAVGGLEQDHAVSILAFLVFALWLRAAEAPERLPEDAVAAVLLSTLVATMKLSAAPLALGSVMLLVLWRRRLARSAVLPMAASGALLLTWIVRGLLLSGCVAFPAVQTCVAALPWAAPEAAAWGAHAVREWARVPGAPVGLEPHRAWIGAWLRSSAPSLAVFGSALAAGLVLAFSRGVPRPRLAFLAAWGAAAAGVAFWFASAPDVRFGLGYLFPFALLPAAHALSEHRLFAQSRARRGTVVLIAGGVVALAAGLLLARPAQGGSTALLSWPEVPVVHTELRRSARGFEARVPTSGDQCWLAPRPCTPELEPGLSFDRWFSREAPPASSR